MTKDLISYIRFIHGYLFLLILLAFSVYLAGNTWGIDESYLSMLLEYSAVGAAAYFVLSLLILLMLIIRKTVYRTASLAAPLIITVLCTLCIIPVYLAAEGLIIILQ